MAAVNGMPEKIGEGLKNTASVARHIHMKKNAEISGIMSRMEKHGEDHLDAVQEMCSLLLEILDSDIPRDPTGVKCLVSNFTAIHRLKSVATSVLRGETESVEITENMAALRMSNCVLKNFAEGAKTK